MIGVGCNTLQHTATHCNMFNTPNDGGIAMIDMVYRQDRSTGPLRVT